MLLSYSNKTTNTKLYYTFFSHFFLIFFPHFFPVLFSKLNLYIFYFSYQSRHNTSYTRFVYKIPYRRAPLLAFRLHSAFRPSVSREQRYLAYKYEINKGWENIIMEGLRDLREGRRKRDKNILGF